MTDKQRQTKTNKGKRWQKRDLSPSREQCDDNKWWRKALNGQIQTKTDKYRQTKTKRAIWGQQIMAQGWWTLIKPEIQHTEFSRQFREIIQPQQRGTIRGYNKWWDKNGHWLMLFVCRISRFPSPTLTKTETIPFSCPQDKSRFLFDSPDHLIKDKQGPPHMTLVQAENETFDLFHVDQFIQG